LEHPSANAESWSKRDIRGYRIPVITKKECRQSELFLLKMEYGNLYSKYMWNFGILMARPRLKSKR